MGNSLLVELILHGGARSAAGSSIILYILFAATISHNTRLGLIKIIVTSATCMFYSVCTFESIIIIHIHVYIGMHV